jgi:UDP-N-acetylglucosamine 2-epimerase (non-hydrolysing)
VIAGTRPEAIKVAPVVRELRTPPHADLAVRLIATGQHPSMVADALDHFHLVPDTSFGFERANHRIAGLAGPLTRAFDEHFAAAPPHAVLVQGDTTSALVAAQVAHWHGIEVVHLEAGLRTGDLRRPFPEEANRRGIAAVASLHLAPTAAAAANLLREGIDPATVIVTGNTVVDALASVLGARAVDPRVVGAREPGGPVVITVHRRETWGRPLRDVCRAVRVLAVRHPAVRFVWPVHPGSAVDGEVRSAMAGIRNLVLAPPMPYPTMAALLAAAHLVLTDSGGLQEEAAALGVPALVLRDRTERPEGVDAGAARLVGTDPDEVVSQVDRVLSDRATWQAMATAGCPYGDGRAASRCAEAIARLVGGAPGVVASARATTGRRHPTAIQDARPQPAAAS